MASEKSGRGGMNVWTIAPSVAGAVLGFLLFGAGGCQGDGDCSCPPPSTTATIELGCVPAEPPTVTLTGPCSICPPALPNTPPPGGCSVLGSSSFVAVTAIGAGTCHVALTFANGATSSVDLDFVSEERPACCGSGDSFLPMAADGSVYSPTVQDPTCNTGQDAGASE